MTTKLIDFYLQRDAILNDKAGSSMTQLAWDTMEEKLIREELLPELLKSLAPILKGMPSSLNIHIDYAPDGHLSASFTRNTMQVCLTDEPMGSNAETEPEEGIPTSAVDADASAGEEHENDLAKDSVRTAIKAQAKKTSLRIKIRVTTPEGKVFYNNKVWCTLRDVVLYAGIGRVQNLNMIVSGIPLVADFHVAKGTYANAQHEIAQNVFLFTNTNTRAKIKQIKFISDKLGLNLKIELESSKEGV